MAFSTTGKIHVIGPVNSIPFQGKVFQKREFVLDVTRYNPTTGEPMVNYINFELVGNHVNDINSFAVGQIVNVTFALAGRKVQKDGQDRYFTNIQAFRIEPHVNQVVQSPQMVTPNAPQPQTAQPANNWQSNGGYIAVPQPQYPQVNYPPTQGGDLPF